MFGKHPLTPWILLTGILIILGLIATTDIANPVIRFIHNETGNGWQFMLCILFATLGFRIAYLLLNGICNFYSDRFDARDRQRDKNNHSKGGETPSTSLVRSSTVNS